MYNNCVIHQDKRVPKGVHSTDGTAVDNTRRAVFSGAQAGLLAFGRDYGALDRFKWVEELFDSQRVARQGNLSVKKQVNSGEALPLAA